MRANPRCHAVSLRRLRPVCLLLTCAALCMGILSRPASAQQHETDAKAMDAFRKVVESYRKRPGLSVKSVLQMKMGEADEDVPEVWMGPSLPEE